MSRGASPIPSIVTAPASPIDGAEANRSLARVAASSGDLLARLHAIWGLGQLGRIQLDGKQLGLWDVLGPLLDDRQAEVRAQAARVLGEVREPKAFDGLVARLDDASPRVRSFAAIALGKLGRPEAVGPLLAMLRADGGKDAVLRHAAVMGLVGSASMDRAALKHAADDASPSARMGVLLAMRRLGDPEIGRFLKDADPRLVLEAARAINDVPIDGAMPALAELPLTSVCADAAGASRAQRPPAAGPRRGRRGAGRRGRPRPACPPRCASRRWRCSVNGRARRVATR